MGSVLGSDSVTPLIYSGNEIKEDELDGHVASMGKESTS